MIFYEHPANIVVMNPTLVRQPQMEQAYVDQQLAGLESQFSPLAGFGYEDPFSSMDTYLQGFANVQLSTDTLSSDTPLTAKAKEALFAQQLTFAGIGYRALTKTVEIPTAAIADAEQNRLQKLKKRIDSLNNKEEDDEEEESPNDSSATSKERQKQLL